MSIENLLIIGNGFDLQCELKSSYHNFFNSNMMRDNQSTGNKIFKIFEKIFSPYTGIFESSNPLDIYINSNNYYAFKREISILTDDSSFCFWNLIFMKPQIPNSNWNDIEKRIEDIVCNSTNSTITVDQIEDCYRQLLKTNNIRAIEFNLEGNQKYIFVYALYLYMNKHESEDIYLYLLDELKKFENQFFLYLKEELKNNQSYKKNIRDLLSRIYKSNSDNVLSNVINFNYTTVKEQPSINIESNVHGSLTRGQIIFGIDLSNLTNEKGSFYFTKTYRKMHAFENVCISDFKNQAILDKNIESISFYGHSLNESDYSYFQSVFDFYEIYKSDILLIFYYSIYDIQKINEIKESYTNDVINLLNTYGKTMANKFHGKNFLHKLMLENRVILKEI